MFGASETQSEAGPQTQESAPPDISKVISEEMKSEMASEAESAGFGMFKDEYWL